MGAYYYYALILANFNPVVADEIFDLPAHEIAKAIVSQRAYNYIPKKK